MDHDYCKVPNNDDFTDVEYLVEEFENVKPYLPTALRSTAGTQTDAEVKGKFLTILHNIYQNCNVA